MGTGSFALDLPKIIMIALAVVALIVGVIGFFRRFSRMSWVGLQVFLLFACTFLVGFLPQTNDKTVNFLIAVGAFLVAAAVVLGLGMIFRAIFRNREEGEKRNFFFRLLDRIFGVLNALVNLFLYVAVFGGTVLTLIYYTVGAPEGVLQSIYTFAIGDVVVWDAVSKYILDFLLTALFVAAIKGGYRLGLFRSIWAILVVVLLIASMAASVYMAFAIPFMSDLAKNISAGLVGGGAAAVVGNIVGYFVSTAICFTVCVVAIVLFGILFNLLAKLIDKVRFFRWVDGVVLTLVFFVIAVAGVCVGNFGISYLSGAEFAEQIAQGATGEVGAQIVAFVENMSLDELATSSQFARILYENNPILVWMG